MLEIVGLWVFASLFILTGINHVRNHDKMAGYATTAFGDCPYATQLGYLGGWPTGLFLVVFGVNAGLGSEPEALWFYGLAAFLLLATALFHRNFVKDPCGHKTLALAGAALVLAQYVG